jgi:hypothetical protein
MIIGMIKAHPTEIGCQGKRALVESLGEVRMFSGCRVSVAGTRTTG